MLCIVEGGLGAGKTLLLTALGKLSDMPVVSNYNLNYKYEEFDLSTFIKSEYANRTILMDEGYVYLDSRISMGKQNRFMSYVLFQSRKKNVHLFISVQLRGSLDIRFRQLADYIIYCERLRDFNYFIFKPSDPDYYAHCSISLENAEKIFPLYDTNEVVQDEANTFQFLSNSEKIEQAEDLCEEFMKYYKKQYFSQHPQATVLKAPTQSVIRVWLMKNDEPLSKTKVLYDYVKSVLV